MLKNLSRAKEKRWVVSQAPTGDAALCCESISRELGLSPIMARLLYHRGYRSPFEARSFLRLENEMLGDPFGLKDMEPAVERILLAIRASEPITVYGDYDVDGVTSVCTLLLYLRSHGATVDYYIPNRIGEGYGVSESALLKLSERGTRLIITVDNGITAVSEVEFAKSLGIDVVVTDHHECQETLPCAVAVVDPHRPDCPYPFKELAGVGVVFKLLCALEERLGGGDRISSVGQIVSRYSDLISIGTIADVMPIKEENRLIVKYGLAMIARTERPGLRALIRSVSRKNDGRARADVMPEITSSFVGYTIAPRINAAGRIRSASMAVELFLSQDPGDAEMLAEALCEANRERQAEENRITHQAFQMIEEQHDFENDPVIVLASDEWHHGVIGIVASRITEKYGLPAILISFEGCDPLVQAPNDVGKGSGRSIKGLNLASALMAVGDSLVKFGGHELAAGLSVTRGMLETFRNRINAYAREHLSEDSVVQSLNADAELSMPDLTMELAAELSRLEPFGTGNPVPSFVLRNAVVQEILPISGGKHTKLLVGDGCASIQALCFGVPSSSIDVFVGDTADLLFTLDVNEWAGRRSLQMIVKDVKRSPDADRQIEEQRLRFDEIWSGATYTAEEKILPTREHFAAVYSVLRASIRAGVDCMSHRSLMARLHPILPKEIGYIRLKLILRILRELGLLDFEELSDETYRFSMDPHSGRTDLEKSHLLRRIRSQLLKSE